MNTITAIFVAALCLNGALASPVSEVQQESRSIYSTSSGMYLGLNATSLTIVMVVVLGTALAILFATQTGLLTDFLGETSQQRYDQYYQQQEQPYRTKRSPNESKSLNQNQCQLTRHLTPLPFDFLEPCHSNASLMLI
jgi:hypothetical protein